MPPKSCLAGGMFSLRMSKKSRLSGWLGDTAAAWFLPTVCLLSVPVELFLGNPGEFSTDVLLPFFVTAGITMGAILVLSIVLSPLWRSRLSRLFFFLGLFIYLSQILFPVRMSSLIGLENNTRPLEPLSATLWQITVFLILLCGYIWLPQKLLRALGGTFAISILFFSLVRSVSISEPIWKGSASSSGKIDYPKTNARHADGNIYRLLFDSFCSEEFAARIAKVKHNGAFKDFIFYPENRSNYLWTEPSVTCCKTSSFFRGGNIRDWIFHGTIPTISERLMKCGWIVSAYGNQRGKLNEPAHRKVDDAEANRIRQDADDRLLHKLDFADLCLLRMVPIPSRKNVYDWGRGVLSMRFGKKNRFRNAHIRIGTALNVFAALLVEEKWRGPKGHYVEAHINIPHAPWVLDGALGYHPEKTTYCNQVDACLRLIDQFVSELKRLGHYEDATIIVHSDHGSGGDPHVLSAFKTSMPESFIPRINALIKRPNFDAKKIDKCSRALLLIKPARHSAPHITESSRETQTADIPATVFFIAGLNIKTENGQSVLARIFPSHREIHIFEGFMQKKGMAIKHPRCEMNHFSTIKGVGWKIFPEIHVVNE